MLRFVHNVMSFPGMVILQNKHPVSSYQGRVNFTQTVTMDESNILFPSGVKIDSVDVSELDLSTVKLTGPQTFAGKITFVETIKGK